MFFRSQRLTEESTEVHREGLPGFITKDTKNHEGTQSTTQGEPQISQILGRFRACYRTLTARMIGEITKNTKDTVQARSDKPSTAKKATLGGPCVRARRTSGPGACRAWRASHATLWGGAAMAAPGGLPRCVSGDAGDTGAPLRGDGQGRCTKRRQPQSQASKPLNFQASTNQEIQEVQEMQERAASARRTRPLCMSGVSRKAKPPNL